MLDPLVIAPVLIGLLLLVVGATLSRYGIALMGALVGAGAGYLGAPTVASAVGVGATAGSAIGIAIGIVVGVLAAHMLLKFAVGMIGLGVGSYFGLTVLAPILVDGAWYVELGAGLAIGLAVAAAGMVFTHLTMIGLTSFIGAALVSRSLTFENVQTAQSELTIDPLLFETTDPIFLGLFAVGIGLQVGLLKLGYASWLVRRFPGAGMGDEKRDSTAQG
ncbi:phosphate ABC transporter permease [Halovivax limisalsi]|uniref:phosphate ABC transporter permease n=1 Tax=Halovivax limisalsi TaxID=1453760 RepID=UPI001FFD2EB3|nr:phosphate ABC transporter permease [Halovivax limisalsi]